MADFCKKCSIDMFGKDYGDLAGMVDPGGLIWTICEGCEDTVNGFHVLVDHTGTRRKDLESAWVEDENNRLSDERFSGKRKPGKILGDNMKKVHCFWCGEYLGEDNGFEDGYETCGKKECNREARYAQQAEFAEREERARMDDYERYR